MQPETLPPSTPSSFSKGYLIALAGTILWSFTGILISFLSVNYALPSLVLAFWRDLFVSLGLAVAFLLIAPSLFRLPRAHWGFILLYGVALSLFNSMWTFSVEYNGASVATVLAFISPAITALLERWLYKQHIDRVKLTSILLAILGTVLVSGAYTAEAWGVNGLGITFGILTGFFFACYNIFGKTAANRSINSWTGQLYSFGIATLLLLSYNILVDSLRGSSPLGDLFWLGNSLDGWLWLLALGLVPTLGGYGLFVMSLGYLPATVANLIATLEPVLTAIWAYFLLSEQLTGVQLVGSLLIFLGVILLRLGARKRKTAAYMISDPQPLAEESE